MLINLLGPMEVLTDDGKAAEVGGAKQRAVLAQLARSPNVAVPLDLIAEGLWGTDVPPRYRQNLQVYVSTLRRALEPDRHSKAPSRIVGHREAYELVAADDEIDVHRFAAGARSGREALDRERPDAASSLLADALALWRGSPLVDLADQPFAGAWITELLEEHTSTVEDRVAADLACGRAGDLVAELRALVNQFPERERLWEQLMLALYRCGRQTEALDAFRTARDTLLDETGLDPGPSLARTADRILHQDPALLSAAPSTAESGTFPVPLTEIVGDRGVVARALEGLGRHERLVVLVGPGGVGKTRRALAVAEALAESGRDVVWVPLEDVTTAEDACAAVAQGLGVRDLDDPAESLAGRTEVLLLDNLEQIAGLAQPVQRLLEAVGTLQVLATSRSPLGVRGERVLEVQPLDAETDAVTLFTERAQSSNPAFDLDACRGDVVRICMALDGLPLALELASARTSLFSAAELAAELAAHPEAVDVESTAGTGARQGSLHGLVDWSLALLPERSRELLVRLSAVPASFDLDTASAVADVMGLTATEARQAVVELVRGALLRSVEDEAGRRFTMLNTVRSVAAAGLEPDGREDVAAGVADLWVSRFGSLDPFTQPDRPRLAQARADLPTTRWALAYLVSAGRADDAARILLAGRRVYSVLGLANEALAALVGVLESGGLSPDLTPRVLVGAGSCAYVCHDPRTLQFLAAVDELDEDDLTYRVFGHTTMCAYLADTGDPDGALQHATAGLAAADASGDPHRQTMALSAAGWAALRRGAYEDSVTYARAQLALADNDATTALALADVALAELFLESTEAALEAAGEALRLAWRQGQAAPAIQAQQLLGYALVQADDAAGAAALFVSCLRSFASHHDVGFTIETAAAIGLVAAMLGRGDEGRRMIRECNAVTAALFGGELAITEPLRSTAARYGVDISHEEHRVLPPPSPPDLVDKALVLGELVLSQVTYPARDPSAVSVPDPAVGDRGNLNDAASRSGVVAR